MDRFAVLSPFFGGLDVFGAFCHRFRIATTRRTVPARGQTNAAELNQSKTDANPQIISNRVPESRADTQITI